MGVEEEGGTENPVAHVITVQAVDIEGVAAPVDGAVVIGGGEGPVVVAAVVPRAASWRRMLGAALLLVGVALICFLAGSSGTKAVDSEDGDTHFGTAARAEHCGIVGEKRIEGVEVTRHLGRQPLERRDHHSRRTHS